MSFALDVNNVPREHLFPHIAQELMFPDEADASPRHPKAPMLAPTPPIADRVISSPKEQKCISTFTESRDSYMCSLADGGCWKVSIPISNRE